MGLQIPGRSGSGCDYRYQVETEVMTRSNLRSLNNHSHRPLYLLFGSLSMLSIIWLTWNLLNPGNDLPACLFRHVTGIPCPSCGITHSVVDIVQLRFLDALHDNILGFPALLMMIVVPFLILTDLTFRRSYFISTFKRMELLLQSRQLLSGFLVLIIGLNWIYLILIS